MTSVKTTPSVADMPLGGAPSVEAVDHHAPAPFDPEIIAQIANSFFQAPLPGSVPILPNPTSASSPVAPPVTMPGLPDAPAPSVVNTLAPHVPAKLSYGPPDIPQTTIPSVVPTPNIPAPSAPSTMQSSTRPLGIADVPQPGASMGQTTPSNVPGAFDFAAIPKIPENDRAGITSLNFDNRLVSLQPDATPGGVMPEHNNNLYFLNEAAALSFSSEPDFPQGAKLDVSDPHQIPIKNEPIQQEFLSGPSHASSLTSGADNIARSYPSEASPHHLSDTASLLTPPTHRLTDGIEHSASPGAAGPVTHDGLYFISHAGGHEGVIEDATKNKSNVAPAYEPELASLTQTRQQPFDPYRVKRDFPILQQHVHGKPLIWLDNAATTQKPQSVIDRLAHFYEYENSNIHRAAHALAARATDAYEAAREKVRRFLKAPSTKDIIFVRGTTEGINLIAQAWGRRNIQKGDEIVITWLEHHANIVPWQMLCAEVGAKLRVAPVDDRGQIILEEYEKLLNPKTKIVSITQVSNALGTVTPVKEMTAMAHRHGARVVVDGAQSVSHMPIDVQSIDCDFFVFSGHKVFGPTGIGVIYGKADVLEHMAPWQGGGNMIADVTFEKTIYQGAPERFEAGTGNIADAVGLGAAIDYVESIGMEVIARYEHELLVYATEKMKLVPGLTFIGTAAEKASVLSFTLAGHEPLDVGKALDREGIAVRAGHHCAQPILRRFGLEATVRPSLAFYNTCADVDALVATLMRLQAGF
jgi:cysteine desulfurase/selenocysteine lyase